MKRIHVVAVVLCLLGGAGAGLLYQELRRPPPAAASVQTGNYSAYLPEGGRKVVFYSLSACEFCKLARGLLEKHSIAYELRELDASEAHREQARALGARSVPLLIIGDHKVEGWDEARIVAILEQERFLQR